MYLLCAQMARARTFIFFLNLEVSSAGRAVLIVVLWRIIETPSSAVDVGPVALT